MKHIIRRYLRQYRLKINLDEFYVMRNVDLLQNNKRILYNQFIEREQDHKLSLGFIIPGMPRGSGGHTSILRLGTYLEEFGHKIYYISYKPQRIEEMIANAKYNLENVRGKVLGLEALNKIQVDVGVATYWLSAYYLWNMNNAHYKAYFVQDYEPDFYPAGDIRVFVENTYRMGYHVISLGSWNKSRIEKEIGGCNVDAITFPYEPGEYWVVPGWELRFREKKVIRLCAYLKGAEKRGGVLLLMGLEELYKATKTRGIELEISLFGDDKKLKYPISIPYTNLGKLSKDELRKLYNESDFGISFSYTNISLVPLEMMACGCPVVEVGDGSFKAFFGPDCAILIDSFPRDFVGKIMYYIEHPDERKQIAKCALKSLEKRTWREATLQFRELLIKGCNCDREISDS